MQHLKLTGYRLAQSATHLYIDAETHATAISGFEKFGSIPYHQVRPKNLFRTLI